MPAQWHIDLADLLLAQSETVVENHLHGLTLYKNSKGFQGTCLTGQIKAPAQVGLVYAAVALL